MTRQQALAEIQRDHYPAQQAAEELEYALKKLRLTHAEFELIMAAPPRRHSEFVTYASLFARYPMLKPLRPFWFRHKKRIRSVLRSASPSQ